MCSSGPAPERDAAAELRAAATEVVDAFWNTTPSTADQRTAGLALRQAVLRLSTAVSWAPAVESPKAIGRVHPKETLFLRMGVGSGSTTDGAKQFELFTNADGAPLVEYRGRFYSISWREIVELAIDAIDTELEAEHQDPTA